MQERENREDVHTPQQAQPCCCSQRQRTELARYRIRPRPGRLHNRVRAVMVHGYRYAFEGTVRLAEDVGVSSSTIRRLLRGDTNPSHRLARAITEALCEDLGVALLPEELFSVDGTYPTPSVCFLCRRCQGCFPDEAFDPQGNLLPAFWLEEPGDWCSFPKQASSPAEAASTAGTAAGNPPFCACSI